MDASQNTAPVPDGAPEGWPWKKVAATCSEVMAAGRRWYEDPEWIQLVFNPIVRYDDQNFGFSGVDVTAAFPSLSRIRMLAGSSFVDATIVEAVYEDGNTVVNVYEAEVPVGITGALLHSLSNWSGAAFRDVGTTPGKIPLAEYVPGLASEVVSKSRKPAATNVVGTLTLIPMRASNSI